MMTIDLASYLATIPDRRRAEGKMYGQVGVILFSIIAILSGARSSSAWRTICTDCQSGDVPRFEFSVYQDLSEFIRMFQR